MQDTFGVSGASRRPLGPDAFLLPAALEMCRPGATSRTIITPFCIAIAWAWPGHIDIVASASGKIVSSSRSKVVRPSRRSSFAPSGFAAATPVASA